MRNSLLLFSLLCLLLPCLAQDEADSAPPPPRALPVPGAEQDAEAAREKLLKATDELDMIQSNAETSRVALDAMKSDIAALQAGNADLKAQLASLQVAFDQAEAQRTKERQALVDEVSQLIASRVAKSSARKQNEDSGDTPSAPHLARADSSSDDAPPETEVHHADAGGSASPDLAPPDDPPPAPRPQKGYYHVVESGETLTMICAAYRDDGVKVSLSEVRKANGLTTKSVLKVGQKLFIPKPGT